MKSALKIAEDGLGDGTLYCSGSSAVPDQANKRFDLTTISIIADLGADADDKFNGYILYFPSSGNKYHIVDWEASTDLATTFEPPDVNDTGPWEIRAALVQATNGSNDMLASNPAFMFTDGFPSIKGKQNAVNVSINLSLFLPNFLDQGGFEELLGGDFPSAFPLNKWGVGAATPSDAGEWKITGAAILGARSGQVVPGGSDRFLFQSMRGRKFEKGKVYRVCLKASTIGTAPSGNPLKLAIFNHQTGNHLDTDWHTDATWDIPSLTTTDTWFVSPPLIPEFGTEDARLQIHCDDSELGSATGLNIDEVYIWEEVDVQSLLVFNHNLDSAADVDIVGNYCSTSRSGLSGAEQIQLASGTNPVNGSNAFILETDVSPTIFPSYRIYFDPIGSSQYEAGQILLCEKWQFARYLFLPHDTGKLEIKEKEIVTLSGASHTVQFYELFKVGPHTIRLITDAEKAKWDEWARFHQSPPNGKQPFVFRYSSTHDIHLVKSDRVMFDPDRELPGWNVKFQFKEVK